MSRSLVRKGLELFKEDLGSATSKRGNKAGGTRDKKIARRKSVTFSKKNCSNASLAKLAGGAAEQSNNCQPRKSNATAEVCQADSRSDLMEANVTFLQLIDGIRQPKGSVTGEQMMEYNSRKRRKIVEVKKKEEYQSILFNDREFDKLQEEQHSD